MLLNDALEQFEPAQTLYLDRKTSKWLDAGGVLCCIAGACSPAELS